MAGKRKAGKAAVKKQEKKSAPKGVAQLRKVMAILGLFSVLAVVFCCLSLGSLIYIILVSLAVVWLALEVRFDSLGKSLKKALVLGLFLMLFDFAVENVGGILGFWQTHGSLFPLWFVPVEIVALTTIGGMAWALYLPRKPDWKYTVFDSWFFAMFGALGESLMIRNGLMTYMGGWTPVHAFFGYFVTWLVLHAVWYKVLNR